MTKPLLVDGYAKPGFIGGMANWIMTPNLFMNTWILVEASCLNWDVLLLGSEIIFEVSLGPGEERTK